MNKLLLNISVTVTTSLLCVTNALAVAPPPVAGGVGARLDTIGGELSQAGTFLLGLFALIGLGMMGIGGMGLYKFFKTEGGGQGQSVKGPIAAFVIGVILLGLATFKTMASTTVLGADSTGAFNTGGGVTGF